MVTDGNNLAIAMQAGVFTPDEAAALLRFPTVAAFNNRRRTLKVRGVKFGREWRYSRETLEAMRKMLFGMDQPQRGRAAR